MKGIQYEASVDTSQFTRGMAQARSEIASLNRAGGSAGNALRGMSSGSSGLSTIASRASLVTTGVRGMGTAASTAAAALGTAGTAATGVGIALVATGAAIAGARMQLQAVAEMDSLTRSLKNIEGSSSAAAGRLEQLRTIAKAPGLGLEEVIKADVRLRSAGLSANLSAQSIKTFGNAIAAAGGSKADLDGVVVALGQIASKGAISAEEINQIAERVPQIRVAMQQAFNTADTTKIQQMGMSAETFINGIIASLAKIPQATTGAQNTLDNFSDSWKELKYEALDTITPVTTGVLSLTADVMDGVTAVNKLTKEFFGLKSSALSGPDNTEAKLGELKSKRDQLKADRAYLESYGKNKPGEVTTRVETDRRLKELEKENEERKKNGEETAAAIVKAEAEAKAQILAESERMYAIKLSEEENLVRKINNLNKAGGNTQADYNDAINNRERAAAATKIRETAELEKQLKDLREAKILAKVPTSKSPKKIPPLEEQPPPPEDPAIVESRMQAARAFKLELDILRAKNSGQEDYAKTLQRQYNIEQLKLSIMRQQGVSASQALAMARERVALENGLVNAQEKKKGVAGAEESARRRYDRLSRDDKKKAGSFEDWLRKNPAERRAIEAERREKDRRKREREEDKPGASQPIGRRAREAEAAAVADAAGNAAESKTPKSEHPHNRQNDTLVQVTTKILEKLDKFATATA